MLSASRGLMTGAGTLMKKQLSSRVVQRPLVPAF